MLDPSVSPYSTALPTFRTQSRTKVYQTGDVAVHALRWVNLDIGKPQVPGPDDHRLGKLRMPCLDRGAAAQTRRSAGGPGRPFHRARAACEYQVR